MSELNLGKGFGGELVGVVWFGEGEGVWDM